MSPVIQQKLTARLLTPLFLKSLEFNVTKKSYSFESDNGINGVRVLYVLCTGAKLQATNRVLRPVDRGTATRYGG